MKLRLDEIQKDAPINLAISRICVQSMLVWLHVILKKSNEFHNLNVRNLEKASKKAGKLEIDLDTVSDQWRAGEDNKFVDTRNLKKQNLKRNKIKSILLNFKFLNQEENTIGGGFVPAQEDEDRKMSLVAIIGNKTFVVENGQLKINKQEINKMVKSIKMLVAHEVTHSSQTSFSDERTERKMNFLTATVNATAFLNTGTSSGFSNQRIPVELFSKTGVVKTNSLDGLIFPTPPAARAMVAWWREYLLPGDLIEVEAYSKEFMTGGKWDRNTKAHRGETREQLFLRNLKNDVVKREKNTGEVIAGLAETAVVLLTRFHRENDPEIGVPQTLNGYVYVALELSKVHMDFYEACLNYAIDKYKLNIDKGLIPKLKHELTSSVAQLFKQAITKSAQQPAPSGERKRRTLEMD